MIKNSFINKIKSIFSSTSTVILFVLLIDFCFDVSGDLIKITFHNFRISFRIVLLVMLFFTLLGVFLFNNEWKKTFCNKWLLILVILCFLYFLVLFVISINFYGFKAFSNSIRSYLPIPILLVSFYNIYLSRTQVNVCRIILYLCSSIFSLFFFVIFIIFKFSSLDQSSLSNFANTINNFLKVRFIIPRPNGGGIYSPLQTMILISIFLLTFEIFILKKYKAVCFLIINLLCIFQSMTRTYYICLILFIALVIIFGLFKNNKANFKKAALPLILYFVLVLIIMLLFGWQRIFSTAEPGTEKRTTDLNLIKELVLNPLIMCGHGFGIFESKLGYTLIECEPLQALIQCGFLGLFLIFSTTFIFQKCRWRYFGEKPYYIVNSIIISLFVGSFFNPLLFNTSGVGLVLLCSYILIYDSNTFLIKNQDTN